MKAWLTDAGYLVQFAAFVFVLAAFALVLGYLAHTLYGWLPPAWFAWVYPGGGL